jgi:hypothetical protein
MEFGAEREKDVEQPLTPSSLPARRGEGVPHEVNVTQQKNALLAESLCWPGDA